MLIPEVKEGFSYSVVCMHTLYVMLERLNHRVLDDDDRRKKEMVQYFLSISVEIHARSDTRLQCVAAGVVRRRSSGHRGLETKGETGAEQTWFELLNVFLSFSSPNFGDYNVPLIFGTSFGCSAETQRMISPSGSLDSWKELCAGSVPTLLTSG